MLYLDLGPSGSQAGEAVTYNGTGWIDRRNVLYVHSDSTVDSDGEIGIYPEGYDTEITQTHYDYPFLRTKMIADEPEGSVASLRWNTLALDGGALVLQPDENAGHADGHVYIRDKSGGVSSDNEATLHVETGLGTLLLQASADNVGLKRDDATNVLQIQWENAESAETTMSVEMFKSEAPTRTYGGSLGGADVITNDYEFDLYGQANLRGRALVGNQDATEQYELPRARPLAGVTYPSGSASNRFPMWDGLSIGAGGGTETLKWWTIAAGTGCSVNHKAETYEVEINASGVAVTPQNVTVVTDVEFDASAYQLKVTYKEIGVISNSVSTPSPRLIGAPVDVVIDNDVNGNDLRHEKKRIYVIGVGASAGMTSYHSGTDCP